MKRIITRDESITYEHPEYKESYHSHHGALGEAEYIFIEKTNLVKRAENSSIKILDVGFGLGINLFAALHHCLHKNTFYVVSLEKEPFIIPAEDFPKSLQCHYAIYKELLEQKKVSGDNFNLSLKIGDATETIKGIDDIFDVIFLDAFSPPKNPELWTTDFFRDLRRVISEDGVLATYSAARSVRDNLSVTGFRWELIPGFGKKKHSLLAMPI